MLRSLIVLCLQLLVIAPTSAEVPIHLILSDSGPAYMEVADAFRKEIGQRQPTRIWLLSDLALSQIKAIGRSSALLVPIGVKAANWVAENHTGTASVLALMLPRAAVEKLDWPAGMSRSSVSAVYIDQPASRSLALAESTFQGARRIGLMVSPENSVVAQELAQAAARRKLKLNIEYVNAAADVSPALSRILPESDVLMLVPDTIAINTGNARNVLLSTYRYRVPVLGFSQGLAKAGAVASVYSSPTHIGRHGAMMALKLFSTGVLPAAQHADMFSIAFNPHVARSLGLTLPEEAEIRRKLGASNE